jgi:hypothetical protein
MFIELTGIFDGTKISFNLDHIIAIMPYTARNGNKNVEEGTKIVTVMDSESDGAWVVQESYDEVKKLCETVMLVGRR